MDVITSERGILGIIQALFDATPGAEIYYQGSEMTKHGMSLPLLTFTLIRSPEFNSSYKYSSSLPPNEFATRFSNDLLGNRASPADKAEIASFIVQQLAEGTSRGDVMSIVFDALLGIPDDNLIWGNAAAHYKLEVIDRILENTLGNSIDVADIKSELRQAMIDGSYHGGFGIADLTITLIAIIDSISDSDQMFGHIAHRFHNKLDVSEYYSLYLQQPSVDLDILKSILAPVTANDLTVDLARMKADYFTGHTPYQSDVVIISKSIDISSIDTSVWHKAIIDAGTSQTSVIVTATMSVNQAVQFDSIVKGASGRLLIVDSIDVINAKASELHRIADGITGLVSASTDLSNVYLGNLSALAIGSIDGDAADVIITAQQAASLFGRVSKGAKDRLAVIDSIDNINAAHNVSAADTVIGYVPESADLSSHDLSRLTDIVIGVESTPGANVIMMAFQTEQLLGHIYKAAGTILTVVAVPSELNSLPDQADQVILNVTINSDLRTLDISKCVAMRINDGTISSISATVLAAQAQSLAGKVTKGIADKLIVDDKPVNVLAAADLSAADIIYATDLSGEPVSLTETELERITELRTAGITTLSEATSGKIQQDLAKIFTNGGKLLVNAAKGDFIVTMQFMGKIDGLTTQPDYSITLTEAINNGLPGIIDRLHTTGSGKLHVRGAVGENFSISEATLDLLGTITAATGANILVTGVSSSDLVNNLAKLIVSGRGGKFVEGALFENFNLTEDIVLTMKGLKATGGGNIAISNVHNGRLAELLAITEIVDGGSVSISGAAGEDLTVTPLMLSTEPISSVTAAAGRKITLNNAAASTLQDDLSRLHTSGGGVIDILGASGQSLSISKATLDTCGAVTATGNGNITVAGVTADQFINDLSKLTVGSGKINLFLTAGQFLAVTPANLLKPVVITAVSGENITLNSATAATLANDLTKLQVSGGGVINITGATNADLSVTEAHLASIGTISATGSGNIVINDVTDNMLLQDIAKVSLGTGKLTINTAPGNFTISLSDLAKVSDLNLKPGGSVTLADSIAATLAVDLTKLHVSGGGVINIQGSLGESFNFTETQLEVFGAITATGSGNITASNVTATGFATVLSKLTVATGLIDLYLKSGESLSVTPSNLVKPVSITAAAGDSLSLTSATGATIVSNLAKLHVSGGGFISVAGANNEHLTLTTAEMASVDSLTSSGTGNITVTGALSADVSALLNKLSATGSGTVSVTFGDAATATVDATTANNKKIIASDISGKIVITNDPGKQIFYATPGLTGYAELVSGLGDSTSNINTCDVLNLATTGSTLVNLSSISAITGNWNVTKSAKATDLAGSGLLLDPAKFDTYVARVGSSDYLVYETAVDGSSYEAIKIVGTVTPDSLVMDGGKLYLG